MNLSEIHDSAARIIATYPIVDISRRSTPLLSKMFLPPLYTLN